MDLGDTMDTISIPFRVARVPRFARFSAATGGRWWSKTDMTPSLVALSSLKVRPEQNVYRIISGLSPILGLEAESKSMWPFH